MTNLLGVERFVWVCVGGAFGSGARYALSGWVLARAGTGFPWGTLAVNAAGSFLLGAIMHAALATGWMTPTVQLTLTVGVLGGFTTYSTFNYETLAYLQQGAWFLACANVLSTVAACLAAGFLGQAAARSWIGS